MSHAKRASKGKRRRITVLGATGVSLAVAGGAYATAPTANVSLQETTPRPEITLSEEEIADVSLATFYVFDKENESQLGQGIRLAAHGCGCGRCGGFHGCGGCGRCAAAHACGGRCGGFAVGRCAGRCGFAVARCARCGCAVRCGGCGGCGGWGGWWGGCAGLSIGCGGGSCWQWTPRGWVWVC